MARQSKTARTPRRRGGDKDTGAVLLSFLRDHPAIVGTLLYAQVSAVGLVYTWRLYRQFGVNVFDFAEANDFLLAAFKEPFAFLQALGGVALLAAYIGFTRRWTKDWSLQLRRRMLWASAIVIVLYTLAPAVIEARRSGHAVRTSPHQLVKVTVRTARSEASAFPEPLALIGTTEKFTFFFDRQRERAIVIPIANIVVIEFVSHADSSDLGRR